MARDVNGNFTLASGNPVTSGTTITSTWANNTLSDIATEITASLDRNGKGGMLAAFKHADGTEAAPGLTFTNDTDTGIYRPGDDAVSIAVGGADVVDVTAAGVAITGTLTASGKLNRPSLPTVGQQVSSTVAATIAGSSLTDVTGATVTITTTGRPVMVGFMALGNDPLTPGGMVVTSSLSVGSLASGYVLIKRGSTIVAVHNFGGTTSSDGNAYLPIPGTVLDAPAAGTYVYKASLVNYQAQTTTQIGGVKFVAYEL